MTSLSPVVRSVGVVYSRIEATGLREPADETQTRQLTLVEGDASLVAFLLALLVTQQTPLIGAPVLPAACGVDISR
jgi:hypothetical protein